MAKLDLLVSLLNEILFQSLLNISFSYILLFQLQIK